MERRRPRRRLTTSHSRKTERRHRLSPLVFVLTSNCPRAETSSTWRNSRSSTWVNSRFWPSPRRFFTSDGWSEMRQLIIGLLLLAPGGIFAQNRPNLILIFTTDNGALGGIRMENGDSDGFPLDPWKRFGANMRGRKGSPYEGGHRVPFFIRWPRAGWSEDKDQDRPAPSRKTISSLSFRVRSASGSNPTWRY